MRKRIFAALICGMLIITTFSTPALADLPSDPATDTQIKYAPESNEGYYSEVIGGNMSIYTAVVQKSATVYENDNAKKSVGKLKKGDIVVIVQHTDGGYGEDTKWTKLLYNGKVAQVSRASLTASKKEHPEFYIVLSEFVKNYAQATKNVTVYSKASSSSKKLGTLSKGSNVVLVSQGKSYDTILAGSVKGYIRHGNLKTLNRDNLSDAIAKAMGSYIEPVNWDYEGRITQGDRNSRHKNSPYVVEMFFPLQIPNYEYQIINEFHFPAAIQADKAEASLRERRTIELVYSDTIANLEWNDKYTLHCYRNKNVIIVYVQGDEDAVAVLNALEKTHGKPFKVWSYNLYQ